MFKLRYYIILFVLAFVVVFVVKFPASSALALALGDNRLDSMGVPLQLQSLNGTVWDGRLRGRATVMEQSLPIQADWDFKWWSLLTLSPKVAVKIKSSESQLQADVGVSKTELRLRDASGTLKPSLLNSLLASSNVVVSESLVIEFLDFTVDTEKVISEANGKLTWAGGETQYPDANKRVQTKTMKPLDLTLGLEDNALQAKLMPQNDATQVVGSARVDLNKSAQFEITPRLLEYQGISFPRNAQMDQPIFSQEILLSDD